MCSTQLEQIINNNCTTMFINWVYNLLFTRVNVGLKIIDSLARVIFYVSGCFALESADGSRFNRKLFENLTLYSLLKVLPVSKTAISNGKNSSDDTNETVWKDDILIPSYNGSDDQIKVRIYLSNKIENAADLSIPTLLYFHGGGFCVSHIDSKDYDNLCCNFARNGYSVISVEYRLSPEHRFPAAVEDAFAALYWCQEQKKVQQASNFGSGASTYLPVHDLLKKSDFSRLIVGGDSAGGNLSAVLSHLVINRLSPHLESFNNEKYINSNSNLNSLSHYQVENDNNIRIGIANEKKWITDTGLIKQLLLIYPSVDRQSPYKSNTDFEYGFIIPKKVTNFFTSAYKPIGQDIESFNADPRISPILFLRNDSFSQLNAVAGRDCNVKNLLPPSPSNIDHKSESLALPPTTLITVELDPLRDAGEAYARALVECNVKVNYLEVKNTVHGFFTLPFLPETKETFRFIMESISKSW